MTETKNKPNMFDSLLKIQKELKTIHKNKSGYSGKFADIENVWESIRNLVNENGFVISHLAAIREGKSGVITTAYHNSGDKLESFIPFVEWDTRVDAKGKISFRDPQEQGKEITYYKRYNIGMIFNLVIAEEDNDANKTKGNYKKQEVDGTLAAKKLRSAGTHEDAKKIYKSLSDEERKTSEVVDAIGFIKEKFALN